MYADDAIIFTNIKNLDIVKGKFWKTWIRGEPSQVLRFLQISLSYYRNNDVHFLRLCIGIIVLKVYTT